MPLTIEQVPSQALPAATRAELHTLCSEAYGEDLRQYFADIGPGMHILGWRDGALLAHAMWMSRALYCGQGQRLNAAYVELVATRVSHQRLGFATEVMRELQRAILTYDIAALSPSDPTFYERLGWEMWRGPLMVRASSGIERTPDESVMILRLPATPRGLDLDAALMVDWRPGEVW